MKRIEVYARQCISKTGNMFIAYSSKDKDGKYYQVKFKKTNNQKPTEVGYHILEVEKEELSIQFVREIDRNDILWVGKVNSIETIQRDNKEFTDKVNASLDALFRD